MTEQELLKGCIEEDRVFQREFYKKFAGKMLAVCMRYATDKMEAEDILQEGFIKIFDNLSKFEQKGSLEGWVRRIMVNTALNHIKTKKLRFEEANSETAELSGVENSGFERLNEQQLLEIIGKMPEGYKMVFNLSVVEGFSHSEIGEMLGIEEATSRSQLAKARKYLQQVIIKMEKLTHEL